MGPPCRCITNKLLGAPIGVGMHVRKWRSRNQVTERYGRGDPQKLREGLKKLQDGAKKLYIISEIGGQKALPGGFRYSTEGAWRRL